MLYTHVLTRNLVTDTLASGHKENLNKIPCQRVNAHLEALKSTIDNCGISLDVGGKLDAKGKGRGSQEFTSLINGK